MVLFYAVRDIPVVRAEDRQSELAPRIASGYPFSSPEENPQGEKIVLCFFSGYQRGSGHGRC